MAKRTILVDDNLKELCEHGTPSFPMCVTIDELSAFEGRYVRCHWHDDLEIVIVKKGQVHYQIQEKSYILKEGEGIVINSDVPHSAIPYMDTQVELLTIIVQPVFLYDNPGSDIAVNCFQPFLYNQALPCVVLKPSGREDNWERKLLELLNRAGEYYFSKSPFFELKIKSLLTETFYELLLHCSHGAERFVPANQENLRRLRILLEYLHANYQKPFSLGELAEKLHFSKEFCSRFFKQMTGRTITEYLTDYRISQSIPLLLDGRYSISQIAEQTGFSNPSRYAKAFRLHMGTSPKDYILQNRT